jgi:hypothetical protein
VEPSNRKIVTRSPSRTVRIINLPSLLPAPVEAESSLEADFVRRAVLIPGAVALIAQPFRLPVSPKGYTPDYLLSYSCYDKKAIIEIKIARKVARYQALFDRAAVFLNEKGYAFYVVTEKVLRRDGVDQRVSQILRYAKSSFPSADISRADQVLVDYPRGLPIGTLCKKAGVSRELVLHLIARRRLTTGARFLTDDAAVISCVPKRTHESERPLETILGTKPWPSSNRESLQEPDSEDLRTEG